MCRRRIRVPDQWYGDHPRDSRTPPGSVSAASRSWPPRYGLETIRWFVDEWFCVLRASGRRGHLRITEASYRRHAAGMTRSMSCRKGSRFRRVIDIDPDGGFIDVDVTDNPDCVPAGLNLSRATAVASVLAWGLQLPRPVPAPQRWQLPADPRSSCRENCIVGGPALSGFVLRRHDQRGRADGQPHSGRVRGARRGLRPRGRQRGLRTRITRSSQGPTRGADDASRSSTSW